VRGLEAVATPRRAAALAAAATLAALLALAGGPGIGRDEARVLAGGRERPPGGETVPASDPRPAPPLASHAARATGLLSRAGVGEVRAQRTSTAIFGALLTALLVLAGHALAGAGGAALAPALFWLVPRHLHAGIVATPDLAAAALWLATVTAWRRALRAAAGGARLRSAALTGVAFGAALATRLDAWLLLVALAVHAAALAISARRRREARGADTGEEVPRADGAAAAPPAASADEGRRGAVPALASMAILGPILLLALWPSLLEDPSRLAAALAPGTLAPGGAWQYLGAPLAGRFPPSYPLVLTALTVPAAVLWVYAGGAAHAIARTVRLGREEGLPLASDDLVLLLAAGAPFLAAMAGLAPLTAGVRPWLPAMPFLALLGARALARAAELAWPARRGTVLAGLAILVLYPALRQAAHAFPAGASAWSELAGGAPGAASRGLQRQDGGEAAGAVLPELNDRARGGARVWWPRTDPGAVAAWTRSGRLRDDLALADGPDDADIVVATIDGASRDGEYRAWAALRTARPVAAAYLDDVPLVFVYARAGAWR
jgi:hypothetical protein